MVTHTHIHTQAGLKLPSAKKNIKLNFKSNGSHHSVNLKQRTLGCTVINSVIGILAHELRPQIIRSLKVELSTFIKFKSQIEVRSPLMILLKDPIL